MKRRALFEPAEAEAPGDLKLRSKRVMEAPPPLDVSRANDSHQQLQVAEPQFDARRAESAHKHVKALNMQFASWVQSQLEEHSDELWIEGVEDYKSHATQILVKFKDVVDWLKANTAKASSGTDADLPFDQNSHAATANGNSLTVYPGENNLFSQVGKPLSLTSVQSSTSHSSAIFSSNQTPVFDGKLSSGLSEKTKPVNFLNPPNSSSFSISQSSGVFSPDPTPGLTRTQSSDGAPKVEASVGADDDENEQEQPSSPSFKKTEEKGIAVVYESKCKVYLKPNNPEEKEWKDMGIGRLFIKCKDGAEKATKGSKPTVIIRNDAGKILLNAFLYPGIKMNIRKNTITTIFHSSGSGHDSGVEGQSAVVPRTYLLKLKNEEETSKLAEAINEYAPAP